MSDCAYIFDVFEFSGLAMYNTVLTNGTRGLKFSYNNNKNNNIFLEKSVGS